MDFMKNSFFKKTNVSAVILSFAFFFTLSCFDTTEEKKGEIYVYNGMGSAINYLYFNSGSNQVAGNPIPNNSGRTFEVDAGYYSIKACTTDTTTTCETQAGSLQEDGYLSISFF
jgi:hypothetical protein